MVEDLQNGNVLTPGEPGADVIDALIKARQPDAISYQDWTRIDSVELEKGVVSDRPRVKFTNVKDMLNVLER